MEGAIMTASRVSYLSDEIKRMERRLANIHMSEPDRERAERYLVQLRADHWLAVLDMNQTNAELAAMDPSNEEPANVAA
jgi:uncharacterized protein YydD (DUF2326 family)